MTSPLPSPLDGPEIAKRLRRLLEIMEYTWTSGHREEFVAARTQADAIARELESRPSESEMPDEANEAANG